MFGPPCALLQSSNLLPFTWTCVVKPDRTKKSHYACNSSLRQKGTVTIDNTHAASLEQSGSRLFWALSAITGLKVHGSDDTNAFAEVPPPVAPLFVTIDDVHKDWHENYRQFGKIEPGHVHPVQQALQGYP